MLMVNIRTLAVSIVQPMISSVATDVAGKGVMRAGKGYSNKMDKNF